MLKLRPLITAMALAAVLSPAAHAASADKTFTVSNTGNGAMTISGAAISGNTAEYALLPGHTCTTVAPGGSCALTVRFTPAGTGTRPAAALNFTTNGTNGPAHQIALSGAGRYTASCKDLLAAVPGTPSGNYMIDPDGAGAVAPFSAYCDMTSNGGGWTMVVRQYEGSPVGWTGQASGNSFTLAQSQVPAHTQVGFGKDDAATYVDYTTFQYTTGNIPVELVTGLKTGLTYHIHRNTDAHYGAHDPEEGLAPVEAWNNTLTFDMTGGPRFTWAFSPNMTPSEYRGYSLGGLLESTRESFAWTVWVR